MNNSRGDRLPLTLEQTQAIQHYLIREACWRDLALFMVGTDSHLRASDLLRLKVSDLIDIHGVVRERIFGPQKKNKSTYEGYLSEPTRMAVLHWVTIAAKSGSDFLFTGLKRKTGLPITREGFGRRVKFWVTQIGLDPTQYSTKSLRKSRIIPILEAANFDYQVPKEVLNHADIRSTIHYCKVNRTKAFAISRSVQFFKSMNLPPPQEKPL